MHSSYAILINELDKKFHAQEVLNAIGIIYSEYWLQANVEQRFLGHLALFKSHYCHHQAINDDGVMCLILLDGWKLDHQAYFLLSQ
jgi:hypothetical protein